MWRGETVAVVLPTYNEAESIADCIRFRQEQGLRRRDHRREQQRPPRTPRPTWPGTTAPRGVREPPGLRRGDPPGPAGDRRGPGVPLRAGRHLRPPRPHQAYRRSLTDSDAVFGSGERSTSSSGKAPRWSLPAVGQLGRGQLAGGALQHHLPERRRLHLPGVAPPAADRADHSPSFASTARRSGWRSCSTWCASASPFVQVPVRYLPRAASPR